MNPSDVAIVQGLQPEHREALIRLFCGTFPEIIMPVFGSVERCARLLELSLASNRILTAISDSQLVGFACLNYSGQEWFDPSLRQLLRVMQWGMCRVLAMGIILFKRPKPDVLHLDTLVVHADSRGQGVGTQLLQSVEALAQSEGKRVVTLEVEDTNPRAKKLYASLGFCEGKFEKMPWPWRRAFAFSGSYQMSKEVASSGA